jgi:hypothetical protein
MRIVTASLVLVGWAAVAAGQQTFPDAPPPVLIPSTLNPPSPPPTIVNGPSVAPPIVPPAPGGPPLTVAETVLTKPTVVGQHTVGVQVQFGEPTGVRLQWAAIPLGDFALLLEGFAGARDQFWGHEGVYGAGFRGQFTALSDGSKNALLVGPGVGASFWEGHRRSELRADQFGDFYVGDRRDDRYYLNLDVNVSWVHELPAGFAYELGVNGGIRVGLNGHDNQGRNISGRIPGGVAGVFTGIRY